MSEYLVNEIRRITFDSIEDENELTQEHRSWLLNTLKSLTASFHIRKFLETHTNKEEIYDANFSLYAEAVDYIFENFIKT